MSVAAMLPPSLSKEVRALAVPWMACVACMLAVAVTNAPRIFGPLAVIAYLVGTVALGALSIGHEYTGRTLSLLLTLPARRERLFATKLGVLTVMLLTLWLVADVLVFRDMPAPAAEKQRVQMIPVMCGLFLAPWLTMLCRSAIAGTVFALVIPGALFGAGERIGVAMYGYGSGMEDFRLAFVSLGTLGLCAVGAVAGWQRFARLEAIDGHGQEVGLPRWLRPRVSAKTTSSELTRRHPVWLLVHKELRLQRLPLVLAAFFVVYWLPAAWLATPASHPTYGYILIALTFVHAGLVPMLIGSSASAGERQIDTLQSQLLLPMAAWKQWAVKVFVVFASATVLGLGLPALLLSATRSAGVNPPWETAILAVMLLSTGSLYISSLCRSGLWALLLSMPAFVGSMLFLQLSFDWLGNPAYIAVRRMMGASLPRYRGFYVYPSQPLGLLLVGGAIALALRFAFINHRFADRPAKRVWIQVILMATFVAAGIIMGAAWQALRR